MSDGININVPKKGARTLVKCIVCGEILDSSLEICPVCGVDKSFFIPYEEVLVNYKKNTEEIFLILGNGAAGVNAAQAIRDRNETCSIVILSNEPVLTYNRPMLTKSISSYIEKEDIIVYNREWYKERNIINILSTTLNEINPDDKYVVFDHTEKIMYDKCIYALGAESFIPPIVGHEKKEVIAIRRYSDVQKITSMVKDIKNVVVIGGGVLGLEAAWEMKKLGCHVTVLEVADKLMGRQLDDKACEILGGIIRSKGLDFFLKAYIKEITGEDSVTGVLLEDGRNIPADMVIISSGIRPNVELAKTAGIEIGRSILVNEYMETSVKDIYACGDCAEYKGINYALWAQAIDMGKTAGANATGDVTSYEIVPASLTFHGMDTTLFSIGDNGKTEGLAYDTHEIIKELEKYEKYYFVKNCLVGCILIGDTSKMPQITNAVLEHRLRKDCSFLK